jgi:hypothetical protein
MDVIERWLSASLKARPLPFWGSSIGPMEAASADPGLVSDRSRTGSSVARAAQPFQNLSRPVSGEHAEGLPAT